MPSTLVEKIIARAAGLPRVAPGDTVTVSVDLLMAHDSSGPRHWKPRLEALGTGLWDPAKVVIVSDHFVPATDIKLASILKLTRQFVEDYGIEHFFDMEGICHTILQERGFLKPGMFIAGGDSHTTMAGSYGCYAAGFGATDTTAIAAIGETWLTVPDSIKVTLKGTLHRSTCAKDIMLRLCRELGSNNNFRAIEYTGPAVAAMSMAERSVLSNMAAELGAEAGIIGVDDTMLAALAEHGHDTSDARQWVSDRDASYLKSADIDVGELGPQIAAPHSPENSGDVGDFVGARIDQCYIGACVGARTEDLHMAAQILRGRTIAKHTRLLVAPSSTRVMAKAAADGTLNILADAGATFLPSGCGACAGFGAGVLAADETCLSTTNRNFKGRMGHSEAHVYLGSPYSVAAGAIAGEIVDPREFLAEREYAS